MEMNEIVAGVKKYAMDNYEAGWDEVIECWTDADIAATATNHNCTTIEQTIAKIGEGVMIRKNYADEIRSSWQ